MSARRGVRASAKAAGPRSELRWILRSDAPTSTANPIISWNDAALSAARGSDCQGACTDSRILQATAVRRIFARVSSGMSLASQPSPVVFLSGNHSKASKPLFTANSNGSIMVADEKAVWLPIFMMGMSDTVDAYLRARLDYIESAF